ncbi:unnamed protein product, partial [Prorocentrum cordatum]
VDPHGLHALGSERSLERRGELDFDDMEWQRILRGAPLGQEGLPVHVPHHGVRVRDGVRDVRTSAGPGAAQGGGGRGGRRGQRVRPRRGGSGRGDRGWSHAGGPAPLLVRAAPEGSGLPLWGAPLCLGTLFPPLAWRRAPVQRGPRHPGNTRHPAGQASAQPGGSVAPGAAVERLGPAARPLLHNQNYP